MSSLQVSVPAQEQAISQFDSGHDWTAKTIMTVLNGIRPSQSNGLTYDVGTNLADAGFTSVEMVKVMLGVEAAFDLMIPQEMITPQNFTSAATIVAMIDHLRQRS